MCILSHVYGVNIYEVVHLPVLGGPKTRLEYMPTYGCIWIPTGNKAAIVMVGRFVSVLQFGPKPALTWKLV